MTWMDSYYRVHALTLSWVRSDDDMADWVDEVIGPLDEHLNLGPMLWVISALMALTSASSPLGVSPCIYQWACRAIGAKIHKAIEMQLKKTTPPQSTRL
ncbi:hypothetical protein [Intestinimonas massiliensis (ex Afouda et al. 2020)]|uniref:hypothetical protein n=1 Tax=Intestinimonas massiliensis (ex Afouda et al. 2020) TaxID=1673721 RepID=UPI00102F7FD9|nr:hypothetical protein [Intestinimonas massiliensis (ex Afouda et al. 2020)]